ncbi:MAG TPA: hypothetical protein VLM38_19645 [Blastocatellia bacterium]|nr:hypothetical protein [Blastocatellia bacterium]
MNRRVLFCSLIAVYLMASGTAFGQKGCDFNIVGTWKASIPGETDPIVYRFTAEGTVVALRAATDQAPQRGIANATYTLDNFKAPKKLSFTSQTGGAGLELGTVSLDVSSYDDTSFTVAKPGSAAIRLVRLDPNRYFVVLAGRTGVFYDRSGPTFPMLIKVDGQQTRIDALGIYSAGGKWAFGPVPVETYKEFLKEPRSASDVMLRLEITAAQYERGLKIMQTWEKRVRQGDLLYSDLALDNILLVKQVTESLNQCSERIKLYKLDWMLNDRITRDNRPSNAPFEYFKELRRLNESLHVRDEQFYENRVTRHPAG